MFSPEYSSYSSNYQPDSITKEFQGLKITVGDDERQDTYCASISGLAQTVKPYEDYPNFLDHLDYNCFSTGDDSTLTVEIGCSFQEYHSLDSLIENINEIIQAHRKIMGSDSTERFALAEHETNFVLAQPPVVTAEPLSSPLSAGQKP